MVNVKNYYMYVLRCSDGSFYGGFTTNVFKRLITHNSGKGAKYTRARLPVRLLYFEKFTSKSAALKAEYEHQSRKAKEKFLKDHGISF